MVREPLNDLGSVDVPRVDETLIDEVELTTQLIIAASETDGDHLSQPEIDRLLRLV